MKKFSFSLRSLLKIKKSEEKQLKSEQMNIEHRLSTLEAQVQKIKQQLQAEQENLKMTLHRGIPSYELPMVLQGFAELEKQAAALDKQKRKIEWERFQCQKHLLKVRQSIRSLEILQDRQYARYQYDLKRQDEKELESWLSGSKELMSGRGGSWT